MFVFLSMPSSDLGKLRSVVCSVYFRYPAASSCEVTCKGFTGGVSDEAQGVELSYLTKESRYRRKERKEEDKGGPIWRALLCRGWLRGSGPSATRHQPPGASVNLFPWPLAQALAEPSLGPWPMTLLIGSLLAERKKRGVMSGQDFHPDSIP